MSGLYDHCRYIIPRRGPWQALRGCMTTVDASYLAEVRWSLRSLAKADLDANRARRCWRSAASLGP